MGEVVIQLGTFGTLLLAVGTVGFAAHRRQRAGAVAFGLLLQGAVLLSAGGASRLGSGAEWLLLVVVAAGVLALLETSRLAASRTGDEPAVEPGQSADGDRVNGELLLVTKTGESSDG